MYQKFLNALEKYLTPIATWAASNSLLQAIKDAFILSMPFTVVGSLSGLVKTQGDYWMGRYHMADTGVLGSIIHIFGNVNIIAMGLIGIVVVLASSYFYAQNLKRDNDKIDPIITSIIALVTYFTTVPTKVMVGKDAVDAFAQNFFSYEGMFTGLVIGLVTAYLYGKLVKSKFTIRMPASVPPGIMNAFRSIIPIALLMILFSCVKELVSVCGFDSLQQVVQQFVVGPLTGVGTGLPAIIIVIILMQLLWFFGIHGFSIMWGLISALWMPIFMEQVATYAKTGSLDSIHQIAPNTMTNVYAMIGGSGSTLALVVLMLFMAPKGSPEKEVGKLAIIPGLFGINEPVTFGLPIVLNPIMFIPWVFIPVINAVIAYFALSMNLITPLVVLNSGAEPVGLNVLVLAAFHLSPVIMYFLLFLLDLVLYAPFARIVIKKGIEERKERELKEA